MVFRLGVKAVFGVVAAFLAAPSVAVAQETTPPAISVSARGEVRVTPDRAQVQLSVQTRATTAADAVRDNAARQTQVIQAIRKLGIPDRQISTEGYSVSPETRNDKESLTPRIVSYRVSNTISVTLTDVSLVGRLLDAAVESGANDVSSIAFFSSEAESAYQRALAAATANATAEARAIATAAGGRLGALIDLGAASQNWASPMTGRADRLMAAAIPTPIMAGEQTVSASVSGRWIFIPNP
jgi:uncharacterized protein YggE